MTNSSVLDQGVPVIGHWRNGGAYNPQGANTLPVHNPASGAVIGHVALADLEATESVISAAEKGFQEWSRYSIGRRQSVIFKFRELLVDRQAELARIITTEHGKVLSDAAGEISRGLEVVDLACGFPEHLKGEFSVNASTDLDVYSIKQALGVVAIIAPFNFPAMVPMWFFPVAIAAGNSVVVKPSEKTPTAALWIAELWKEAGLPDGVFNVLQGDKTAVDGLLQSPTVQAVSFVGSTPIAQYIYEEASRAGKRVQALGGAKNHMIVMADADLNLAADQAVNAGYGAAGERCMAISVVLAADSIADELSEKILERIRGLRIGDGAAAEEPDMGPLISQEHRTKVSGYVDIAESDGARILHDGRGLEIQGAEGGYWFGPTLIDDLPLSSRAYTEEIFGPVLSLVRIGGVDEGIELINSGEFGNGTAIFTSSGATARKFQTEVEVGMVGVNVPIPVPVAYHSFGGWKHSLYGNSKAYGAQGFEFYTREKVITSRWPEVEVDRDEPGQINLAFPQNE